MQIIPMRDLKNTVEIEKMCQIENGPIFVTKNGYGKLVVMNIDYYEKLMRQLYEVKAISEGLEDLNNGKVIDGKQVINELKGKYGL